ncbi:TPA: MFS transporter [Enterococcus faecium]|uniref:MFS transporter n=1 Tax=Enterococcus TaxID=1350 RepID=UPI0002A2A0BC|nr:MULTISPECIES: MFS transporter [Enterococcus]ELA82572.1 major facilitator superfamily transporter [Enterococcus faecium EnGen0004]EPI07234.1 transporter, major facilitator family protein [Enterococcus faecium SD3B-2]MDP8000652.1 MFS transporter [Enterococcus faecium]MEB4619865.1 MFS transporter [Enterococcus sp. E4-223]MEB7311866.1 MFS transporter [Enterococcus faecium]
MTKYQRKVLLSTSAGIALENMDIMFLAFSLSSMIASFHISGTQAGFISTITNLGMLIGGIFFGIIADKYGRVKVFSQTVLLFSIASLLMYFASNIYLVYLFRFIAGVGAGGEYGACMSLISESFSKKQIGRASSVAGIGAQVGAALAAILAALIIPAFGWKMLYVVGVLPVLMVLFIRRGLTEPKEFKSIQSAKKKTKLSRLFETKHLAWQTCGLSIMVTVQIAGYFGLMNWLPSIMQDRLGLSVSGSSLWMVSTILGMSLGMMTFGMIMDKMGPKLAFSLFLICSSLSVYLLVLAHNQWSLVAAAVIVGYFINGMYGGYGAVISSLYPTEIRATANNFIMNLGRAVGGFSSIVIGFLMDHYSLTAVILFLSGIYLVSLLVLTTLTGVTELRESLQH